jgi:hypothetical protein
LLFFLFLFFSFLSKFTRHGALRLVRVGGFFRGAIFAAGRFFILRNKKKKEKEKTRREAKGIRPHGDAYLFGIHLQTGTTTRTIKVSKWVQKKRKKS